MMMYVFQLQFIDNLLTPGENTDQPLPNSPYIQLPNLRFNSTEVLMKRRLFALTCRIFPQMVPTWVYAHQFSFVSMFEFFLGATMMKKLIAAIAACLSLVFGQSALAQQKTVRIGAIYPLSGALESTGAEIKAAIELAVDIVNNPHPELGGIPLASGVGLPNLGGAKIEVVFGDSQGKPEVGLADAQRLIDQEKVVALTGAYQSAVTKTASRVAEQAGIPYLNAESSSPDLTDRGYKWFFRTTPNDDTFVDNMMQFLNGVKKVPTQKIAVVDKHTD